MVSVEVFIDLNSCSSMIVFLNGRLLDVVKVAFSNRVVVLEGLWRLALHVEVRSVSFRAFGQLSCWSLLALAFSCYFYLLVFRLFISYSA